MLLVLGLAVMLWFGGRLAGVPDRSRISALAILLGAVVLMQLALPAGHPLREATGGSPAPWLILGGLAVIVLAYSRWLANLRGHARSPDPVPQPPRGALSETELERYARHIVLRELGGPGQKRLHDARVLVIGAGGLGSPALLYLAGAGIGTIGVIDDDKVDNANLQRQIIHQDAGIGLPKVFSAQKAMEALNPYVQIRPYDRRLTEEIAPDLFADYDVILDGSDNFKTRYLVNRVAVRLEKPLISGALTQWEGQISVFDPALGAPCYQCVFPEAPAPELAPSCAQAGVLGPLPGVIGAMMAAEAVKVIADAGAPLRSVLLIYDALYGETRQIRVQPRPDCPVCGPLQRRNS